MLTKTRAIVLHALRYSDTQIIVDLLTEGCGRVSCIVKVSTSPKAKFRRQHFQPLTILDLVLDLRHTSQLQHIKELKIGMAFKSLPFDARKLAIGLFTAEFLRAVTSREPTDDVLFAYIENSLRWLDECTEGFAGFHLVFMMRLTRFMGFYPNTENYVSGSWFDLRSGCFCPIPPLHNDVLHPADAAKISLLMRMNFPTMHLYKMSHDDRNRTAEVIINYYRLHLPGMPELKSLGVLKEVFA